MDLGCEDARDSAEAEAPLPVLGHPLLLREAQAGDLSEAGANLGGPVDVFPLRDRRRKERPPG